MKDIRTPQTKKQIPRRDDELREAFREVATTQAGQTVLRAIMGELGWKSPMLAVNRATQEVIANSTIYNVAKRDAWIIIRQFIPYKLLNAIEAERKPYAPPKNDDVKVDSE